MDDAAPRRRDVLVIALLASVWLFLHAGWSWALLALPAAAIGGVTLWARTHARRVRMGLRMSSPPDSSRWAGFVDVLRWRVRGGASRRGFVLGAKWGMQLCTGSETSVLVIGPTRSGKTSALVVPNVLRWSGPAVVTSTKSEVVDITIGRRQLLGPVYVYDPTGELPGYEPAGWSPQTGCDDLDRAWRVASWLCAGLQHGAGRSDSDWAHWAESGKLLTAPLLFAAAAARRSIIDVQSWIHGFDLMTPMAILDDLAETQHGELQREALRAITMLTSVDQRPEKERGTVFSTMMRVFNVFNERAVAASAMTTRFEVEDFLRRSGTLYLCTPRQSPERISGLFVGLLMTVVTAAYALADSSPGGRLPADLGLFLDELPNIVPVEELPSLASQGAGRGVVLMSIVQDLSQLRSRYGIDRAYSVINNHTCKLLLPGISDPETMEVFAKLAGQRRAAETQVSRGPDGRTSHATTHRLQALAPPDLLRQLPEGGALALFRSRPPALLALQPWYQRRAMRSLAALPYVRGADEVRRAA